MLPNDTQNAISRIRHDAGLTQQAMSELLHIPSRTIEDWEAGRRTPTEWVVELIAYRLSHDSPAP